MIILGLTGSIGMGKSTTAQMLREFGLPVHDADAAVHELYRGSATAPIEAAFPGTVISGAVDRQLLAQQVLHNPAALKKLESIVHPLVSRHRDDFLSRCRAGHMAAAVLDIPLLFETGAQNLVDRVIVVTAPTELQRSRVLARPNMTPARLDAILAQQMPDIQKRAQADFIVDTSHGMLSARKQIKDILESLGLNLFHA